MKKDFIKPPAPIASLWVVEWLVNGQRGIVPAPIASIWVVEWLVNGSIWVVEWLANGQRGIVPAEIGPVICRVGCFDWLFYWLLGDRVYFAAGFAAD